MENVSKELLELMQITAQLTTEEIAVLLKSLTAAQK